jgi:hypothetical protein
MPSTSIRKTEYDPETRVLSVWFVASGKRYDYEGRFFNDHIRDRFRYRLVANA